MHTLTCTHSNICKCNIHSHTCTHLLILALTHIYTGTNSTGLTLITAADADAAITSITAAVPDAPVPDAAVADAAVADAAVADASLKLVHKIIFTPIALADIAVAVVVSESDVTSLMSLGHML